MRNEEEAIRILAKNPYEQYNSRNLSKIVGISHAGMFKLLKKLEKGEILISKSIGKAKIYSINFSSPIALRKTAFALALESFQNKRWIEEFGDLEHESLFVVLFGSILRNPKEAEDIDILVVSGKNKFIKLKEYFAGKNKLMAKKIHSLIQTKEDFLKDLRGKNKAILEIIKTGRVLFGQDEFVRVLGEK